MSGDVIIEAPAKVNLCLDILGRRPDGYHEIDTVMLTVGLSDTLRITPRNDPELNLSVDGRCEGVPADERNLVFKAAERLRDSDRSVGADIHLHKRVPTGAGLGGGSSDAASALLGLRAAWNLDAEDERLADIAADLGSDVPFFIRGGAARCRGRGEVVEWLETKGAVDLVLVFSDPLATSDVYSEYARMRNESSTSGRGCDRVFGTENGGLDLDAIGAKPLLNALTAAAISIRGSLSDVRQTMIDAGARNVSMSGSGSCLFGVAESRDDAGAIVGRLLNGGLEAVHVRSLGPRATDGTDMAARGPVGSD